jgi:isopenicillin-N epimerase
MVVDRKASSPRDWARLWSLDPTIAFLNHGSFGACPQAVLLAQRQLRDRLEQQPVRFLARELEGLLDLAREELAAFLGARSEDLAFVGNATTGVNTVLRSYPFRPGDEILVTDHEYNACRNAADVIAALAGARVVVAAVPFPLQGEDEILEAVLARVGPRTRLALLDHVTSQTGLVFPVARLVGALAERGIDTLVDGAHAPGMVPLRLDDLGAAFYTGNCHKWLCAPKGAAFLHVRRDRQTLIHPLVVSHGANSPRTDRSRFRLEFDWIGTCDPTAYLCVPEAIRFLGALLPGGWPALLARNHELAVRARRILCDTLGVSAPCPEEMLGSLAALPLPDGSGEAPRSPLYTDPLQDALCDRHGIEVPVIPWPAPPKRLLRISAQIYNTEGHYLRLAEALRELLPR